MVNKHNVRAKLSAAVDEMQRIAGLSRAEGFSEKGFDTAKRRVEELNWQLKTALQAEGAARHNVTQLAGQDGERISGAIALDKRLLWSSVKNFRSLEIDGRRVSAEDQAYEAGMWARATLFGKADAARWCEARGVSIQKAQGEGVNSAGSFLVPEKVERSVIVLREKYGVFRRQARVIPMGSDVLNWPRLTTPLTANFIGEGQQVTESTEQWDSVTFSAKKLATLNRLSTELDEDAVIFIGDWLVGEIAYAFASKEDDCGFNGDGTSTYGGMRGLTQLFIDGNHTAGKFTAAAGHNTFSTLAMSDFTALMGTLPQYAGGDAKWYVSQLGYSLGMVRLGASATGNTINSLTGTMDCKFLGAPVVICQKMPSLTTSLSGQVMVMFGNLSLSSSLAERRGIVIKQSFHKYFEFDQIGLRGTERFDINNHDLGNNTTAGPVVALVAP
jgi:HK97 family phage major capsid protein